MKTTLPTGKEIEFSTEQKSREAADAVAKMRVRQKHNVSQAGRMRWKHQRDRDAALANATAAPPPAPTAPPPRPPPTPEQEAAPIDETRAADIAAKLRSLGDGQAIDPDDVIAPGARDDEDDAGAAADDDDDELDDETAELLADLTATAVVAGTAKLVTRQLAKRKPPERPGEPHDKMAEWYHSGARHQLRKLFGNTATLGPTGKLFVGGVGMVISMLWGAEAIDDAMPKQPAAAAAPAPAHANGTAHTNGTTPAPPTAPAAKATDDAPVEPAAGALALGRFH